MNTRFMRKGLLVFIILFFSTVTFAQLEKKTWLVGGSGSYSSESLQNNLGDKQDYQTFEIRGTAGYFIAPKFSIGLRPDFYLNKAILTSGKVKSTIYAIGPFARFYILPKERTVNILLDGAYLYGRSGVEGQRSSGTNQFSISGGPAFFLNRAVALELLGAYTQRNLDTETKQKNKKFSISVGLQFHLQK